jgi:undecaprenyl phosphate N,N'-diacetylbacillosamine 1-phosphate transferase|tara:strand:- start:181 stop:783 length:603 start_codon:yes stop_codon:yes gene_type:complete
MYSNYIKFILEFLFSLAGIVLISPILVVIILILAISNQGTPFFFQTRPGLNNKLFKVIKFKTMNDKKDENGKILPDSERLTAIGSFIRKASLDEFPQLLNVIKGDMSLVGPRPLLVEYLPLYSTEQALRHNVRPGITGWAQVNGRNAISWKEKFKLDVWYVRNQSFLLDFKILLLTIKKVFVSEGISSSDSVTMSKFKGN